MISEMSDRAFKKRLDMRELCVPPLLEDPHYAPLVRAMGADRELAELRAEWRERQERARARRLRAEASFAD